MAAKRSRVAVAVGAATATATENFVWSKPPATSTRTRVTAPAAPATDAKNPPQSRLERALVGESGLQLVAGWLLDSELVALLRVNRAISRLGFSGATSAGVWWARYRAQYERWRAYVGRRHEMAREREDKAMASETALRAKAAATQPHNAHQVETAELRRRYLARQMTLTDRAWRWTCANWTKAGRSEKHASWYVQYRSYMIASIGVQTRFAVVDCDTHRLHCWLPYNAWDESRFDKAPDHLSHEAAWQSIENRERRALRWVARHQSVYAPEPSSRVSAPQSSASFAATNVCCLSPSSSSSSPPLPPPTTPKATLPGVTHATYLTPPQRGRIPHAPFVYAPNRIHRDNASAARYMDAVECVGLLGRIDEMRRLAESGTAFCVHAVQMYGLEYAAAAAEIERAHCDSIAHTYCGGGGVSGDQRDRDEKVAKNKTPTVCAAETRAAADLVGVGDCGDASHAVETRRGDGETGGDGNSDCGDGSGARTARDEIRRLRARSQKKRPHTRFVRRDCARQVDMSAEWGAASADWELSRNLCARRVTALYSSRLYRASEMRILNGATGRPATARELRESAGTAHASLPASASEAALRDASPNGFRFSVYHDLVVERRHLDASADRLVDIDAYAFWRSQRLSCTRAELLDPAHGTASDDTVLACRRAILDALMRAVRSAVRHALVETAQSRSVRNHVQIVSPLLPLTMVRGGRVWLPFDREVRRFACRLCGVTQTRTCTSATRDGGGGGGNGGGNGDVRDSDARAHEEVAHEVPASASGDGDDGGDGSVSADSDDYCDDCVEIHGERNPTGPAWGPHAHLQPDGEIDVGGDDDDSADGEASVAVIRRRSAKRECRRGWCAPWRDATDHFVGSLRLDANDLVWVGVRKHPRHSGRSLPDLDAVAAPSGPWCGLASGSR